MPRLLGRQNDLGPESIARHTARTDMNPVRGHRRNTRPRRDACRQGVPALGPPSLWPSLEGTRQSNRRTSSGLAVPIHHIPGPHPSGRGMRRARVTSLRNRPGALLAEYLPPRRLCLGSRDNRVARARSMGSRQPLTTRPIRTRLDRSAPRPVQFRIRWRTGCPAPRWHTRHTHRPALVRPRSSRSRPLAADPSKAR